MEWKDIPKQITQQELDACLWVKQHVEDPTNTHSYCLVPKDILKRVLDTVERLETSARSTIYNLNETR